jgi:protein-disulfide isomerase
MEPEMLDEQTVFEKPEKKDRFLPISILIAAVIIGGALIFSVFYHGSNAGANTLGGDQQQPPVDAALLKLGSRDAILGNTNAPVTIIEYGDYQCPYCGQFFQQGQAQIVQNFVNPGKVKFVFRDFPFLGPESTAAANAAQCANDQGKMWAYHDALYAAKMSDFANGGSENDNFFSTAELLKLGQQVGLTIPTFTSCLSANTNNGYITQEKTDATNGGLNSTPTFFVGDIQVLGAQPYSQFEAMINAALKK